METTVVSLSPDSIAQIFGYLCRPDVAAQVVSVYGPLVGQMLARMFGFVVGVILGVGAGIGFIRGWPV